MVKTALKLLLVFVEYSESNTPLLIEAITSVDNKRGTDKLTRHQLLIILMITDYFVRDKVIHVFIFNGLNSRLQAVVQYYGDPA